MKKIFSFMIFGACVFQCIDAADKGAHQKAREEMLKRNTKIDEKYKDISERMDRVRTQNKDFMKELDKLIESLRVSTNNQLLDLYEKYDPGLKSLELKYNQEVERSEGYPVDMLSRVGLVNAGYEGLFSREAKLHENKKFAKEWSEIVKSKNASIANLFDKYDPGLGKLIMKRDRAYEKSRNKFRESLKE